VEDEALRPRLWLLDAKDLCFENGITDRRLAEISQNHARYIDRTGEDPSSTTLEATGDGLSYHVIDGNRLAAFAPDVVEFYKTTLRQAIGRTMAMNIRAQAELRGALSLNRLDNASRYEQHVDESTFTAILYLSSFEIDSGGELVFDRTDSAPAVRITPMPYCLLVCAATDWPHKVTRLPVGKERLCLVMNYWAEGASQARPEGLDEYLYG